MPKKPGHLSWEGFAEHLLRKAMDEGEFANLAGAGKPIESLDEPYREDWWVRALLKREELSISISSLEMKRDVERTLEKVRGLRDERRVREEILALNDRITKVNRLGSDGPGTCAAPLDVEAVVLGWKSLRK